MTIDRSQVPEMPNAQPQLVKLAERIEYRRLLMTALALVAAALAGWLYLRQASIVAAYWHEIGELEAYKTELRQNISSLQTQAAKEASLNELQTASQELSFRRPVTGEARESIEVSIAAPAKVAVGSLASESSSPTVERNPLRRLWQRFQAWLHAEPGT